MSFNVLAQEEESLRYESDLPIEFTAETTVEEIQNDIAGYITWANLSIVYDSDEYVDLMYDFVFYNKLDVNEVTARYYSAYASIYLAEEDMSLQMGKTIQQVKDDTMLEQSEMEQYYADAPEAVQTYAGYNIETAKSYAQTYAIIPNFGYPLHGSDCTNFASQILVAGGFQPNSSWNYQAPAESAAWYTWLTAGSFLNYWSLGRGYQGPVCRTRSQVNANAEPGDFLSWQHRDTAEIYHTQFVQSKSNGEIYCTQHTSNYCNEKFNDRVSTSTFKNENVFVIDFTR